MATRGHTGVNRTLLGSVADALMRWGELPALLLRGADGRYKQSQEAATSGL